MRPTCSPTTPRSPRTARRSPSRRSPTTTTSTTANLRIIDRQRRRRRHAQYRRQLVYDPNGQFESLAVGETALDVVSYSVDNSYGATSVSQITVTITGENDLPTAQDDHFGAVLPESPDIYLADGGGDLVLLDDGRAISPTTASKAISPPASTLRSAT